MKNIDKSQVAGWIAVGISTIVTCFWAFWGIVENFHEGWYHESLFSNLGLMFLQYLSPFLIFLGITLISLFRPRLGSGLLVLLAVVAIGFFQGFSNAATFLIIIPLIGLAALYWFGRPEPRKLAINIVLLFPLLTLIISGAAPVIRVSQRIDDGDYQARLVSGNGVELIWAPAGSGWPEEGGDWYDARNACQHLGEDGLILESSPVDTWRLPTVDEAVRSMALHRQNSGGSWDDEKKEARYDIKPDKESPLWKVYSQVIYWWTATEVDQEHAYIIAYDGGVWSRLKDFGPAYLGYRCVRMP